MEKLFKQFIFLHLFLISALASAQSIGIRVPDTTMVEGQEIMIPVYADSSFTGKGVLSYQLQLQYADYYLQPIEVITTNGIAAQFGSATVNNSQTTLVNIAGAGASPLTGKGVFLYIRFKALHPGGSYINYTGAANNYFNEGNPAVSFKSGYIQVSPAPKITISPNNADLLLGDSLQMSVSGDTLGPFTYSVLNPTLATISSKGLLKTLLPGITKVMVEDANGITDITDGNIQVFGYRLSAPSNISQWQGGYVNIPIYTTNLSGLNVVSGNFTFNYNSQILEFVQVITDTTLLNGLNVQINNTVSGAISIAFASVNNLSGQGALIYLRFKVSSINTGNSSLSFSNVMFNETLSGLAASGSFNTINYSNIGISPNSASLVAGDSIQIIASNGIEPYTFETSEPQIATISSQGMLTSLHGGIVQVMVKDSVGAQKTSGDYTIFDTFVEIPDTVCPVNSNFNLPVFMGSLPLGVTASSVEVTLTFSTPQLEFVDLIQLGTLSEGWSFAQSLNGNTLVLAGAGATSIETEGILFYLSFNLTSSLTVGSIASIKITQLTLNEGSPSALLFDGSITGIVNENPCKADFNYISVESTITFTSNAFGNISGHMWDFGDGTYDFTANPVHTYSQPGVYDITFTVSDSVDNCINSTTKTLIVPEGAPGLIQAKYTYSTTGNSVNFVNSSIGIYTDVFWDFGDGSYSTNFNDSHVYGNLGNYQVILTIYNSTTGNMDEVAQTVSITSGGAAQCLADFTFMGNQNVVSFQNTSGGEISDFFWDFGDGNYSFDENTVNTYTSPGYYEVSLSIYSELNNCFDNKTGFVFVYEFSAAMCKAEFSYYPVENTVYFTSTSIGDYSQFFWDFGNGFNSNEENPVHTFTDPGYYEIAYSVIDTLNECFDTQTKTVFVTGIGSETSATNIKADFSYLPENGSLNVLFTDKTIGNVTNWYWDFGDNTPANNMQNPEYLYSINDYYRVCLTASNSTAQETKCDFIAVGDVSQSSTAYFTYFADSLTATARFKNQSL
ncbi:MAG: PKD domain-containing protein, partial [Salinivirgaceae bacterium]